MAAVTEQLLLSQETTTDVTVAAAAAAAQAGTEQEHPGQQEDVAVTELPGLHTDADAAVDANKQRVNKRE